MSVVIDDGERERDYERLARQRELSLDVAASLGGRRGYGAPVRRDFVMSRTRGCATPLSSLISSSSGGAGGGRGGRTRLLLELSCLWIAGSSSKGSYGTVRPPSFFANLLGMEDPTGKGARNVRNAKRDLERRGFLVPGEEASRRLSERGYEVEPRGTKEYLLLKEDGSREDYFPPSGENDDSKGYFRVPEPFWTSGLCSVLDGPGLVMYLLFLSVAAGLPDKTVFFTEGALRDVFHVGRGTRDAGLKNLSNLGVIYPDRSLEFNDPFENSKYELELYALGDMRRTQWKMREEFCSVKPRGGVGIIKFSQRPPTQLSRYV